MNDSEATPALRLTLLTCVAVALFLALFGRLWFLQVLAGDRYAQLAESNLVQLVALEAPRGRILAADGQELVKNRPARTRTPTAARRRPSRPAATPSASTRTSAATAGSGAVVTP